MFVTIYKLSYNSIAYYGFFDIINTNIFCVRNFMKLFKRLLVAPATLGLLAPLAANSTEVNLVEVSNYSSEFEINSSTFNHSSSESTLLAGGEGMVDSDDPDGSFSETTTASFSADFAVASETGGSEAVQAYYGFQIDLNTSFTGEDSLDISIDAGNSGGAAAEFDLNGDAGAGNDVLTVDGVAYTFPLGGATFFVGDNTDGSALFSTACVYGGPSNTLDDCGNGNSAIGAGSGTGAGASYEFGDGFTAAVGVTGSGSTTSGLFTDQDDSAFAGQLSYAADSYGASITYGNVENFSGSNDRNFYGLNGYWTPSETGAIPSISVGYEVGQADGLSDTNQYFVGLQWDEAGPGTFGIAYGNTGAQTDDNAHLASGDPELVMYEAFYSYSINDGMTITPLIYTKETVAGSEDLTGVMVKTSFSF